MSAMSAWGATAYIPTPKLEQISELAGSVFFCVRMALKF